MDDPLTPADLRQFEELGFTVLRQAFPRAVASACRDRALWPLLSRSHGIHPESPSSWPSHVGLQSVFSPHDGERVEETPWNEVLGEKVLRAVDQLVGGRDKWKPEDLGLGWWAVSFPRRDEDGDGDGDAGEEDAATEGEGEVKAHGAWHVDGAHFRHKANSKEQGLLPIFLFSDIKTGGGGTAMALGSHKIVAQVLMENGGEEGMTTGQIARAAKREPFVFDNVAEVEGEAGDIAFLHPFLLHARGYNKGKDGVESVRFICNPCISLVEDMNIDSDNANPSPVEKPIIEARFRSLFPKSFSSSRKRRRY